MNIRFGFVAMALSLQNASPSQTMTVTHFKKLVDREAALRKITRIASSNLTNTLRILRHAHASGIHVYRFSSRLIPLFGHDLTKEWDFFRYLHKDFEQLGDFIREKQMRTSFHPEHFTLINSPREDVVNHSIEDLKRYAQMLEAMGLDSRAKIVLHVGGGYQNKTRSLERFKRHWSRVPNNVKERLTLENDDKTYTAVETLNLCQSLGVPMVLDIHHHRCHHDGTDLRDLVQPIFKTWRGTGLVPKIHVSSPKDETDFRRHAAFIDPDDLIPFLDIVREFDQDIDVMIEAKQKDEALFQLVQELTKRPGFRRIDGGTVSYC
ncbi:MAG: UV DNA damage repair endonuclease UvsE [Novibacillus thermophilus]|uniref:UV damage endonuclease UvsE n=1 Tax=Novibacillus thermophilus TaxID=1471761 RepID=A0A1U9K3Q6_9BACL|nr:UV DNA damage repair endonuclease UvsE [Novibacillus thermophilus]AQS54672.1 UV damage endonuclease UvsE [Novibacillus thermophilus]